MNRQITVDQMLAVFDQYSRPRPIICEVCGEEGLSSKCKACGSPRTTCTTCAPDESGYCIDCVETHNY